MSFTSDCKALHGVDPKPEDSHLIAPCADERFPKNKNRRRRSRVASQGPINPSAAHNVDRWRLGGWRSTSVRRRTVNSAWMTWISLMRLHRCQRNSVTLPYTTLFRQQCLALAKSEHCFCVMTLHRGSLTNVPSNWPGAPSRVYSRTLATTCQLFGLVCASLVLTLVLLLSLVQVVSVVHLCYKYPWDPCNTSLHGRYLTTPVSSEAVGNCLITLSVGVSRTCGLCGKSQVRQEHEAVSVALGSAANWSSSESTDEAVQRDECELDHARGDALVRNLC